MTMLLFRVFYSYDKFIFQIRMSYLRRNIDYASDKLRESLVSYCSILNILCIPEL